MQLNTLSIKVSHGDELRKFQLVKKVPADNHQPAFLFSELLDKLKKVFPCETLRISYTDSDGDEITVSSDMELEAALVDQNAEATNKLLIKVQVIKQQEPEKKLQDVVCFNPIPCSQQSSVALAPALQLEEVLVEDVAEKAEEKKIRAKAKKAKEEKTSSDDEKKIKKDKKVKRKKLEEEISSDEEKPKKKKKETSDEEKKLKKEKAKNEKAKLKEEKEAKKEAQKKRKEEREQQKALKQAERMMVKQDSFELSETTQWPVEITNVYLDGNNMMFLCPPLRKFFLNRNVSKCEAVLSLIAQLLHKKYQLKKTAMFFDSTSRVAPDNQGFEVASAQPKYPSTDDAFVDLAKQIDLSASVFVTADHELRKKLKNQGAKVLRPKKWLNFVKCTDDQNEEFADEGEWIKTKFVPLVKHA
jgi:chemotaxis protein histidine kinase CheA